MSITVTAEDVQKIAALARLQLSSSEVATATADLSRILDNFSALQAIDTTAVAVGRDVTGQTNRGRDDVVQTGRFGTPEELLRRAPAVSDTLLKVPAVF